MISPRLLEVLACPKCKTPFGSLSPDGDLICHGCRLRFEVKDGIPILLIDEATPLDGSASPS